MWPHRGGRLGARRAVLGDGGGGPVVGLGFAGQPARGRAREPRTRRRVGAAGAGGGLVLGEPGEVRDGDLQVDPDLLGDPGRDDLQAPTAVLQGPSAGQETPDRLQRPDGRREADPLRRGGQEGVQALQAEREVRTALAARHHVDLVEDHGLHPGKALAGRRGQHQE